MGRFSHEAVAIDPATGFVYETEDRKTAGFYRFLPTDAGNLAHGGKLQMLKAAGAPDLRGGCQIGQTYDVTWVDIDDPVADKPVPLTVEYNVVRGKGEDAPVRRQTAQVLRHRLAILAQEQTATRANDDIVRTVEYERRGRLKNQLQRLSAWIVLPDLAEPGCAAACGSQRVGDANLTGPSPPAAPNH